MKMLKWKYRYTTLDDLLDRIYATQELLEEYKSANRTLEYDTEVTMDNLGYYNYKVIIYAYAGQ